MSHDIDQSNSRANIAFVGETPWHKLGHELTPNASIETWVQEAGLNYDVAMAPLTAHIPQTGDAPALTMEVSNRAALYRTDTNRVLGLASRSHHKIVQPREMVEFFDDLITEAGMTLEVAGALKGGARVWALAKTNMELAIGGSKKDIVRPYLLLSTSYGGNDRATLAQFSSVRVVCNNTIQMAYQEQKEDEKEGRIQTYVSVPHSRKFNPAKVKAELQLITKAAEQFKEKADAMTKRRVSHEEAVVFVTQLFGKKGKDGQLTDNSQRVIAGVLECIVRSPGADLKTAQGTAWGLLQGVTNFIDFKSSARTDEGRLNSAWFGDASRLKVRAMEAVVKLL